jgi:hypothetical protein
MERALPSTRLPGRIWGCREVGTWFGGCTGKTDGVALPMVAEKNYGGGQTGGC